MTGLGQRLSQRVGEGKGAPPKFLLRASRDEAIGLYAETRGAAGGPGDTLHSADNDAGDSRIGCPLLRRKEPPRDVVALSVGVV